MKRRLFLAATAAALAAGGTFIGFNTNSYQDIVKEVIKTRLHYLKISKADLNKFAAAYAQEVAKSRTKVMLIDFSYDCRTTDLCHQMVNDRINYFENYIVTYFLKSSDFFINGMNENKPVKYLSIDLVDPYKSPCYNPFARLI
ncbi:hypothetical protein KO528_15920 [Saccharophagus degradans]|uniref:hypothetical protein n=1 Tax=Saccharophagus degradans TaxID=86304 RepID=UPI001C093F59|nr:hypothetical protein [Saccharophagus degradans]MBU2986853.1 hypothetical protein [Saccharophagus degradans]